VDVSDGLHVVWSEEIGNNHTILFYTHFDGSNWITPLDLFTDLYAVNPSIATDAKGMVHLVWRGGMGLSYSNVPALSASSVNNWLLPEIIMENTWGMDFPDLIVDDQDRLHLVVTQSLGNGSGIYHLYSTDQGKSWQGPNLVYGNFNSNRAVDKARVAVDQAGDIHVVWTEYNYPITFPPLGIRYSISSDQGNTWTDPISIADGPYDDPGIATDASKGVHVVWSGTSPDRYKFYRKSPDGGKTWLPMIRDINLGGYQGWPALVQDNSGDLHWIEVGTVYSIQNDSLYYRRLTETEWTPGEVLLKGAEVSQNQGFVSAVVGLGNELHVVVQYPIGSYDEGWQNEIYYLHKHLDIPSLGAHSLPSSTPSPSPSPTLTATLPVKKSPLPFINTPQVRVLINHSQNQSDTMQLIVLGILPTILFVGLVIILKFLFQPRK
jgi:hypothetical protein